MENSKKHVISVGIDVVEINRFVNTKEAFIKKLFTKKELVLFSKMNSPYEKKIFLAKTWALKEAIFKANNLFFMNNIELDFEKGRPICINKKGLSLSLSYCDKTITAIAIYNKKGC